MFFDWSTHCGHAMKKQNPGDFLCLCLLHLFVGFVLKRIISVIKKLVHTKAQNFNNNKVIK